MQLISVNLGQEKIIQQGDRLVKTGIFKNPVEGPVRATKLGFERDAVVDTKHHGGPDQAVYIYGAADYDWWSAQLGRDIPAGTFGENLTISDLESARFNIGDLLHVGEVDLQITSPRFPCATFAERMEDLQWVKKFRDAGRPGLYCRVMSEGFVKTGDPVSVEKYTGETLSIFQMYEFHYRKEKDEEMLQRHLRAPIDFRTRKKMEELQKTLHAKSKR